MPHRGAGVPYLVRFAQWHLARCSGACRLASGSGLVVATRHDRVPSLSSAARRLFVCYPSLSGPEVDASLSAAIDPNRTQTADRVCAIERARRTLSSTLVGYRLSGLD